MIDLTPLWDWFRELNAATGIKLTIFYDAFDRTRFINGFLTSVRLMALCIVASVVIGIAGAFVQRSRLRLFRAVIEAVPNETVEAAEALGYSRLQAYVHVILPLAFRICLPALNNNLVNLVKTTTIAYAIAVPEMLYVANQIWSDELNVAEMMNVLLVIYVSLVGVLVYIMGRWGRAMRIPGYTP